MHKVSSFFLVKHRKRLVVYTSYPGGNPQVKFVNTSKKSNATEDVLNKSVITPGTNFSKSTLLRVRSRGN